MKYVLEVEVTMKQSKVIDIPDDMRPDFISTNDYAFFFDDDWTMICDRHPVVYTPTDREPEFIWDGLGDQLVAADKFDEINAGYDKLSDDEFSELVRRRSSHIRSHGEREPGNYSEAELAMLIRMGRPPSWYDASEHQQPGVDEADGTTAPADLESINADPRAIGDEIQAALNEEAE
jgi:hypothetical protein